MAPTVWFNIKHTRMAQSIDFASGCALKFCFFLTFAQMARSTATATTSFGDSKYRFSGIQRNDLLRGLPLFRLWCMSLKKELGRFGRLGMTRYGQYRTRRMHNHLLRVVNYLGPRRRECPCCGWRGMSFLNHVRETYWMPGAVCPRCRSHPRHRGLTLYLDTLIPTLAPPVIALHFAPERALANAFRNRPGLKYFGFDLGYRARSARADIMAIPIKSGVCDLVLSSHVLEHVPSDAAALREIRRVLKPSGLAILMVPMLPDWRSQQTLEFGFPNPAEDGHWRIYGRDFADRINAAGMDCQCVGMRSLVPVDRAWRCGVADAPVFLAHRAE
jgi:hypothetical protein